MRFRSGGRSLRPYLQHATHQHLAPGIGNELRGGKGVLRPEPRPADAHEVGYRAEEIVAVDLIARVAGECRNPLRVRSAIRIVDPHESGNLELSVVVDRSAMAAVTVSQ